MNKSFVTVGGITNKIPTTNEYYSAKNKMGISVGTGFTSLFSILGAAQFNHFGKFAHHAHHCCGCTDNATECGNKATATHPDGTTTQANDTIKE